MAEEQRGIEKHPGGRPLFDGKDERDVVAKLEEVWSIGGSDGEAAFYANISRTALNRYFEIHPELRDRRDDLKEKPLLKARQTIVKSLDNPEHAKWYLERKSKPEFAPRQENTGAGGGPIVVQPVNYDPTNVHPDPTQLPTQAVPVAVPPIEVPVQDRGVSPQGGQVDDGTQRAGEESDAD